MDIEVPGLGDIYITLIWVQSTTARDDIHITQDVVTMLWQYFDTPTQ